MEFLDFYATFILYMIIDWANMLIHHACDNSVLEGM